MRRAIPLVCDTDTGCRSRNGRNRVVSNLEEGFARLDVTMTMRPTALMPLIACSNLPDSMLDLHLFLRRRLPSFRDLKNVLKYIEKLFEHSRHHEASLLHSKITSPRHLCFSCSAWACSLHFIESFGYLGRVECSGLFSVQYRCVWQLYCQP